jgi:hypothetical protein
LGRQADEGWSQYMVMGTSCCTGPQGFQQDKLRLSGHLLPNQLQGIRIGGRDAVKLRTEPIMYMRELMRDGRLSNKLIKRVEWAAGQGMCRIRGRDTTIVPHVTRVQQKLSCNILKFKTQWLP